MTSETYEPFKVYHLALEAIKQLANEREQTPSKLALISRIDLHDRLSLTPGLFFSPGTTWDDVVGRMVRWRWLSQIGADESPSYVVNPDDSQVRV